MQQDIYGDKWLKKYLKAVGQEPDQFPLLDEGGTFKGLEVQ